MASVYLNLPLTSINLSGVATEATLQDILDEVGPSVISFQEIDDLTTDAQSFTAPAGAKWFKISAGAQNGSSNIRYRVGGTATSTSGIRLEPSRTEDHMAAGNISVIAESGADLYVCVIFGA